MTYAQNFKTQNERERERESKPSRFSNIIFFISTLIILLGTSLSLGAHQVFAESAPVASSVSISGTLAKGQVVTGNYTYTDVDGDLEGVSTFRWLNGNFPGTFSVISGATSSTYTITSSDQGKRLKFEVTPRALTGTTPGTAVLSSYTDRIPYDSAPVASNLSVSGNLYVGQVITGHYTYSDADGDLENTTGAGTRFRWLIGPDCMYTKAEGPLTYTVNNNDIISGYGSRNICFKVTPYALTGNSPGSAVTSAVYNILVSPPVASDVSISGSPNVGQVLTGSYTYTDLDYPVYTEGTSTFRWLRDDVAIEGATSGIYTLIQDDAGKTIKFEVTPVEKDYNNKPVATGTAVASSGTLINIPNSAPVASAVSFSGTLAVGQVLSGTYTFTDAESNPDTSTFKWYRGEDAIPLATSQTYTTVLADLGQVIKFEVTPASSSGTSPGVAVKSAGQTILNSAPTATHVTISGSPDLGQTLTGSYTYTDPDSDSEGTSIYKWYRNGTLTTEGSKYYFLTLPDTTNTITFEVTPIASTGTTDGISITSSGITINRRANSGGGGPGPSPVTLPVITHTLPTTSTSHFTFTKTLKLNSQNSEVKELQKLLNLLGFIISPSGAGSPGNETTFFGSKTKQALIKFQLANGLVGDGVMGPLTFGVINGMN